MPKGVIEGGRPGPYSVDAEPVFYEDEETAFILAMGRYQRLNRRRFPAYSEILAVARSLGYRLVADPQALPRLDRRGRFFGGKTDGD